MFSKSPDPTAAPSTAPRSASSATKVSILGPDLQVTGELISAGAIEILGTIEGNLAADQVTIGTQGHVKGAIRAASIDVKGKLDGKVDSKNFAMRSTANVKADITYSSLTIESGATIEGRFSRPNE